MNHFKGYKVGSVTIIKETDVLTCILYHVYINSMKFNSYSYDMHIKIKSKEILLLFLVHNFAYAIRTQPPPTLFVFP